MNQKKIFRLSHIFLLFMKQENKNILATQSFYLLLLLKSRRKKKITSQFKKKVIVKALFNSEFEKKKVKQKHKKKHVVPQLKKSGNLNCTVFSFFVLFYLSKSIFGWQQLFSKSPAQQNRIILSMNAK